MSILHFPEDSLYCIELMDAYLRTAMYEDISYKSSTHRQKNECLENREINTRHS
jgi:hypothetical protein